MAIQPIRGMRVSTTMQSNLLLEQMRVNTLQMFDSQQQLASGLRILLPSDDPAGAAKALRLSDILDRYTQLQRNVTFADNFVAATETALSDARELMNEANSLASANAGTLVTAEERASAATVVDGLISQMLNIANRQHQGVYLFAGQQTDRQPFTEALGGILYQGDTNDLRLDIDGNKPQVVNLRGDQVFGGLSAEVRGLALTPRVDSTMYLHNLRGATGKGISQGSFVITDAGVGSFNVDLAGANTLGDVATAINTAATAAGSTVTASVSTFGISLSGGGAAFSVTEQGTGTVAKNLGIYRSASSTADIDGASLQPAVTLTTPLAWLQGGTGIDQTNGLTITNGGQTATIDLSGAQTVQDVLNAINGTELGVMAKINDSATGIDVLSRLSGGQLSIAENGGTTAADLGIRSFRADIRLNVLNDGLGVGTADGSDFQVTAKDGTTFAVDVDGCVTIQDILDRINTAATAAGAAVSASLATTGNGIRLVDTTGGTGDLRVTALNMSTAADDLGIAKTSSTTELVGEDVNPIRSTGIFTVLSDLHAALMSNDTDAITRAGSRLNGLLQNMAGAQGQAGALGKTIRTQASRLEETTVSAKAMLSDVKDVDMTEAIMRFMQVQTSLQASLSTGSKLMQLSLLDFLS